MNPFPLSSRNMFLIKAVKQPINCHAVWCRSYVLTCHTILIVLHSTSECTVSLLYHEFLRQNTAVSVDVLKGGSEECEWCAGALWVGRGMLFWCSVDDRGQTAPASLSPAQGCSACSSGRKVTLLTLKAQLCRKDEICSPLLSLQREEVNRSLFLFMRMQSHGLGTLQPPEQHETRYQTPSEASSCQPQQCYSTVDGRE